MLEVFQPGACLKTDTCSKAVLTLHFKPSLQLSRFKNSPEPFCSGLRVVHSPSPAGATSISHARSEYHGTSSLQKETVLVKYVALA